MSELGKLTKDTEWTKDHLSKRKYWTTVWQQVLWCFHLGLFPSSSPHPQHQFSDIVTKSQHHCRQWRDVTIFRAPLKHHPRTQSIRAGAEAASKEIYPYLITETTENFWQHRRQHCRYRRPFVWGKEERGYELHKNYTMVGTSCTREIWERRHRSLCVGRPWAPVQAGSDSYGCLRNYLTLKRMLSHTDPQGKRWKTIGKAPMEIYPIIGWLLNRNDWGMTLTNPSSEIKTRL